MYSQGGLRILQTRLCFSAEGNLRESQEEAPLASARHDSRRAEKTRAEGDGRCAPPRESYNRSWTVTGACYPQLLAPEPADYFMYRLQSKEGSTSVENDTSQSHQWGKGKEREEQHSEEKVAISDADRMHTAEAENPMLEAGEPGRLRDEEIQITKYLNELLSHGIRQYSSGFLVEDQCISLWYADRYGVIKSVNFNWVKEPHYLLLVVAALLFADRQRLGFSPFVELDPKAPEKNPFAKATLRVPVAEELDGTQINQEKAEGGAGHESEGDEEGEGDKECHIREGDERAEDQSQRIGERMNIHRMKNTDGKSERNEELAKTKSCTLDSDGKEIAITLEFSFDASSGRRIVTNYGIIGRGTTVIPVKVAGNQVTSKALRMEGDASLVAKLAWQHVDRKEDALIRTIRQALNAETDTEARSMLNHVVDMKCSLSLSMDSPCINLPRIFMSRLRPLPRQDLREFRLLILESYEPLANITKVNDFKKVFIETFKGTSLQRTMVAGHPCLTMSLHLTAHHWVWTKAEVLHRDISINNIMFRRRDGTVEGVLCDWDLAATKSYMGEPMDYSHVDADEIAARIAAISNGPSDSDEDDVDWADMASHDINVLVQNHAVQSPGQTRAPAQSLANTNGPSDSTGRSWKRPRYRTGTGPFMSLELLQSPPDKAPVHRYSFDVQSFFYVFIWVCATHNPQKKEMGNIPQWMHKTLDETYNAKAAYWTSARVREEVINQAHPAYRRLTNTWYRKLLPMFSKAAMTFFAITDLRAELIDALVEDDMERVHDLRAQIKLKAKELEETITYEGFLAALK
ncbi:hypothetical protein K474DRAFT_485138 [Panus rudis PR-1116 ss-1]|nr:hypothetical protein K474DRAFT_485138 [Panus rudis PR-1116 ss-1]